MSLLRRLRHKGSRGQLVREVLSSYILAFLVVFLTLRFIGFRHYYPQFHREFLPVNLAARQAACWALAGPALWVLDDLLRRNDLWTSFWSLDYQIRSLVLAGAAAAIAATVVAWHW